MPRVGQEPPRLEFVDELLTYFKLLGKLHLSVFENLEGKTDYQEGYADAVNDCMEIAERVKDNVLARRNTRSIRSSIS